MDLVKLEIKSRLFYLVLFTIAPLLHSQPVIEFIRSYHGNGNDSFYDIYAVSDSGLIMCGGTEDIIGNRSGFVVRTDINGDVIWSNSYNNSGTLYSVVETDDGDFLFGGNNNGEFHAMMVDSDGDLIWRRDYGSSSCRAVIELKNDEFVLGGYGDRSGRLILIQGNGEPIWSNSYHANGYGAIHALRETNGGVVAAGFGGQTVHFWAIKVDFEEEGDIIWSQLYSEIDAGRCFSMVSSGNGGFALSGTTAERGSNFLLMKIDDEGEELYNHRYQRNATHEINTGLVMSYDDSGYMMVGRATVRDNNQSISAPIAIRITQHGEVRWRQIYDLGEDERFEGRSHFQSVVNAPDGSLIAAGYALRTGNGMGLGFDGIIMKLAPEILHPMVIYHTPEDTVFSVLPGDTTQFIVVAENPIGDSLGYEWFFGDSALGGDTTVTIEWDDLGEYLVQCRVSNDEFTTTVNWHVHITDLYIDTHTPDTLNVSIRRNTTVDFSVTSRAIEGDPVQYEWVHDGEILDEFDDSLSIHFDHGRDHEVEVVAYRGDQNDNVIWQITMLDLIVNYWPREFDLSVNIDTVMEFSIEPFNRDDPSLDILWTVDDDSVDNRSWTFINFDSIGEHQVSVHISDSSSSDSMSWNVMVSPNDVSQNELALLPKVPTLYPPSPNPFNSQTSVRYALPVAGRVRLDLFDVSGRLVSELVDQRHTAGWYDVVIDGSGLVSGVYFVRIVVTDKMTAMKKLVLIK